MTELLGLCDVFGEVWSLGRTVYRHEICSFFEFLFFLFSYGSTGSYLQRFFTPIGRGSQTAFYFLALILV